MFVLENNPYIFLYSNELENVKTNGRYPILEN